mmetsp:Transcript_92198/g.237935  ORF Transcript_92198/g.237935 Transcript_92198/m.237935 type:complete len:250 (-) Transcript_92198:814-1563(-)
MNHGGALGGTSGDPRRGRAAWRAGEPGWRAPRFLSPAGTPRSAPHRLLLLAAADLAEVGLDVLHALLSGLHYLLVLDGVAGDGQGLELPQLADGRGHGRELVLRELEILQAGNVLHVLRDLRDLVADSGERRQLLRLLPRDAVERGQLVGVHLELRELRQWLQHADRGQLVEGEVEQLQGACDAGPRVLRRQRVDRVLRQVDRADPLQRADARRDHRELVVLQDQLQQVVTKRAGEVELKGLGRQHPGR